MSKLGFGIVGTGSRSGSLVRTLLSDEKKRGDVVALCDIRQSALDKYEITVKSALGHGTTHYHDFQEMLRDPKVDVVIISTPDYLHHMMAIDALNAGKHVFCEKPVGINLTQMIDILSAARRSGKTLEIGYVLRYSPFYIKMKEIIETGKIGKPLFCQALEEYYGAYHFNRGWWRKKANTGGIMVQKICHDFDLFCWLFGIPKRVSAFTSINEFKPENSPSPAKYCSECDNHCPYYTTLESRTYSDECVYNSDHDVADNAQIILEFQNGVNLSMGVLFFNSHGQDDRHWKVIGRFGEMSGKLSEQTLRIDPRFALGESGSIIVECSGNATDGHGGGDEVQIIEFLNAIEECRESKAGVESAYWSSISVMGAQISADTGKTVDLIDLAKKYPLPQ